MGTLYDLEVLQSRSVVPGYQLSLTFMSRLQQLYITPTYYKLFNSAEAWKSAPQTLTCLSLSLHGADRLLPGVLPVAITQLQLLRPYQQHVEEVAAALPGLKHLQLWVTASELPLYRWNAFSSLSKLSSLQEMDITVQLDSRTTWSCQKLLDTFPEIGKAGGRGVRLNAEANVDFSWEYLHLFLQPFQNPQAVKSAWSSHA